METPNPVADRFTPLYFRIEERLRQRILSGELQPGDQLPSETELARDYQTTRVTVRQAMTRLLYDELIIRQRGRGSFVANRSTVVSRIDTLERQSFEQQVALRGKSVTYADVRYTRMRAPIGAARQLGVPKGSAVYQLDRLRLIDGEIVGSELRYFAPPLGQLINQQMLEQDSALDFLLAVSEKAIPVIEVSITSINAGRPLAERLGIKPGEAVMVRDNVFRDSSGKIVQCGTSYFRGDVQLQYVLGRLSNN